MATNVTMPQLGESVVEGTIGRWLVREGDRVEKDQPVVEVLTDKADSEIPATAAGVVTKIHAQEGATVAVGQVLLEIDTTAKAAEVKDNKAASEAPAKATKNESAKPTAAPSVEATGSQAEAAPSTPPGAVAASPAIRKLARERGVDLRQAQAENGRISKDAVLQVGTAATARSSVPPSQPGSSRPLAFQIPPYIAQPGDEMVPFSRRRRIIADHMVVSKQVSPHVMTVAECDLSRTSRLRDQHKDALKKEGIGLSFLSFVAAATTRALREWRALNARVLDDAYVLLRDINLGIAVDTKEGLVVPVIRNADRLTVRGISEAIDRMALKARDGRLTPDDLSGKTFTISNPGKKGNLFGAAIISQPNVGILRIGEIQKRVVVIEDENDGDRLAIHPVMYMSLSYDHRIVDGVAANSFLYQVVEYLELGDFEI